MEIFKGKNRILRCNLVSGPLPVSPFIYRNIYGDVNRDIDKNIDRDIDRDIVMDTNKDIDRDINRDIYRDVLKMMKVKLMTRCIFHLFMSIKDSQPWSRPD